MGDLVVRAVISIEMYSTLIYLKNWLLNKDSKLDTASQSYKTFFGVNLLTPFWKLEKIIIAQKTKKQSSLQNEWVILLQNWLIRLAMMS